MQCVGVSCQMCHSPGGEGPLVCTWNSIYGVSNVCVCVLCVCIVNVMYVGHWEFYVCV